MPLPPLPPQPPPPRRGHNPLLLPPPHHPRGEDITSRSYPQPHHIHSHFPQEEISRLQESGPCPIIPVATPPRRRHHASDGVEVLTPAFIAPASTAPKEETPHLCGSGSTDPVPTIPAATAPEALPQGQWLQGRWQQDQYFRSLGGVVIPPWGRGCCNDRDNVSTSAPSEVW